MTSEFFDELDKEISNDVPTEGKKYGLTPALDRVCETAGMYGFVPEDKSFDIGLPDAYRETMR